MITIPDHDIWHLSKVGLEQSAHQSRHVGKQVWVFPRLDSTNTLALALASDPEYDGLVLLANEQTAGRGQYGRSWTAPAGSSVLLSALLFPPAALRRPVLLTALAAVSVCETVRQVTGLEPAIKWPNDILLLGRKVCGILIEQRNTGNAERPLAAAVGIGLNVRQDADFFAQADLPLAGSLATLAGRPFQTRQVAECLIDRLDLAYRQTREGDLETLERSWSGWLGLANKHVCIERAEDKKEGRIMGMSWDGVLLEGPAGPEWIAPEAIRHIHPRL